MKTKTLTKITSVAQILGATFSVSFILLTLFGIAPQEMYMTTSGMVELDLSDAPLKGILIGAIGIVAVLSFLISFIAYRSSKKRK